MGKIVNNCCFIYDLRTGSVIICYITVALCVLGSIVFSVDFYDRPMYKGEEFFDGSVISTVCVVGIITGCVAIHGMSRDKKNAAVSMIIFAALVFIYMVIGLFYNIMYGVSNNRYDNDDTRKTKIIILLIQIILSISYAYFVIVLSSYLNSSIL